MSSPTARSLELLRARGWTCQVVERRIRRFTLVDLFGCIDILAVHPREGILGVQACARASAAARLVKAAAQDDLRVFLAAPGTRFSVWSWAKQGPRGKRKVWTCREDDLPLTLWEEMQEDPRVRAYRAQEARADG